MSRHDADLEHDRQMAAIHHARSRLRSLSPDERQAHAELADRYEHRAQRTVARAFTRDEPRFVATTVTCAGCRTSDNPRADLDQCVVRPGCDSPVHLTDCPEHP